MSGSVHPAIRVPRSACPTAVLLGAVLLCGARADEPAPRDYRILYGVARGSGQVLISPQRGCRFSSTDSRDLAFACSSAPLPVCYRVTVDIDDIDISHSGCRFGIFDEAVRFGGDNESVNNRSRFCVSFQESKGQRFIYVTYHDRQGDYWCWDGKAWRQSVWRPSGVPWAPGTRYRVAIQKDKKTLSCSVCEDGKARVETIPVSVTQLRNSGRPDYFACGDMVNDYVKGEVAVSAVTFEELDVDVFSATDLKHTVIRQAPQGRYAMYGGLARLSEGGLICFYKVGSRDPETGSPWTVRDETIVWARSSDNGLNWDQTENVIYEDTSTRQEICCGNAYARPDGTIMHAFYVLNADYEERAKAENWSRIHLAVSHDDGRTWRTPQLDVPLALAASFGGFLKLSDGTLLLNVYGAKESGTFRHQSGILRSSDDGETWGDASIIGDGADPDGGPARLNETDVVELPDGGLLSMSRTQYDGFPLYRGTSKDRGRTWTVGPSGLTGLCPSLLYTRAGPSEGTIVLAYHDRWRKHAAKGGVYLAFSHDGGATWGEPVWISPGAYPCLLELEPGLVLCSYYSDNSTLRGTILRVPFPTGLRASTGLPDQPDSCGVRLNWDAYRGKDSHAYSYRVFRGNAGGPLSEFQQVDELTEGHAFDDANLDAGRLYYYRVAAFAGDREVGQSWPVAARAGTLR